MASVFRSTFPLAAALVLAACSNPPLGGSSGDGGPVSGFGGTSGGFGGTSGGFGGTSGGFGGTFGGPSGDCALLPCFATFAASVTQCAGKGKCTVQQVGMGSGGSAHYCYENGVKLHITAETAGVGTLRLTRTDGISTCYSVDISSSPDKSLQATYKDGSGSTIGTAVVASDGSVTMTCGGISKTISKACQDQMRVMMPDTTTSTAGCTRGICQ